MSPTPQPLAHQSTPRRLRPLLLALGITALAAVATGTALLGTQASAAAEASAADVRGAELLSARARLSWAAIDEGNATRLDLLEGTYGQNSERRANFVSQRGAVLAEITAISEGADGPADQARETLVAVNEIRGQSGVPLDGDIPIEELSSTSGAAIFEGQPPPGVDPSSLDVGHELIAASNAPALIASDGLDAAVVLEKPDLPGWAETYGRELEPYLKNSGGWLGPDRADPVTEGFIDWTLVPERLPATAGSIGGAVQPLWAFDQWIRGWQDGEPGPAPLSRDELVSASDTAIDTIRDASRSEIEAVRVVAAARASGEGAKRTVFYAIAAIAAIAALGLLALLIRQIQARGQSLFNVATADPLTGAKNRRYLDERTETNLAAPGFSSHAIIMIDLDRFKLTNDTYGHQVGDAVLVELVRRANGLLEEIMASGPVTSGAVVRLGGDEFLIALHSTGELDLPILLERVRRLTDQPVNAGAPEPINLEFSVGASSAVGATSLEDLLPQADLATYADKTERAAEREVQSAPAEDGDLDTETRERRVGPRLRR